ncbi:helix-turn-helix transcriptional regulator [Nocardioides humi]|uniref:HTH luxR-type domain-containing protein n=1 Tax=Nocardioides humi TaxID=449461 RepID=A0ABN2AC18_9ACTN|nr:response regulator transcription factor [Nocardioides humi]
MTSSPPSVPDPASLAATLHAAAEAVAGLPRAIEAQLLASHESVPVEIIHGSESQWAAWGRYAATVRPVAPINCYPDLTVVRAHIAAEAHAATEPFREPAPFTSTFAPRAIIGAGAVADEDDHAVVDRLVAAGMEVRLHPDVPSWLYADAGVLSAVPLVWGEHPPTSIAVIRDVAISTALAALLEPTWTAATPYRASSPDWADTLRLASLGLSDKAIATAQGISYRTVQRRFAEAMAHHGVRSRFELGVVWRDARLDAGDAGDVGEADQAS